MAYNLDELNLDGAFSTDSSELFGTNLDWVEVDEIKGKMTNNKVLVEVDTYLYEKVTTDSGLELWADNSYTIHQYAVRSGRVAMLPEKLVNWEESANGISWKTEIETAVGDVVWFMGMSSYSGEKLLSKGRKYVILDYADLYIAKRGDEVICLNGNILLEPIFSVIKALSFEKRAVDPDWAKIAFKGRNNDAYEYEYRQDDPDLKVGLTVNISGLVPRRLEIDPYLHFDGKEYLVCQNYEINGWLTDEQ